MLAIGLNAGVNIVAAGCGYNVRRFRTTRAKQRFRSFACFAANDVWLDNLAIKDALKEAKFSEQYSEFKLTVLGIRLERVIAFF